MEILILLALAVALLFGIADAVAGIPGRKVAPIPMVFVIDLASFVVFGAISVFFWHSYVWSTYSLLPVISGVAAYLGFLCYVYAIRDGAVGVSAAIGNSYPLLTTLFGVFVLGEILSGFEITAVALMLSGVFLVSLKPTSLKVSELIKFDMPVLFALGALVFWALQIIFLDLSANHLPAYQITHLIALSALVCSGSVFRISGGTLETLQSISSKNIFLITSLSVMYFLGVLIANYVFTQSDLSIPSVIMGTSPFITAVGAYVMFKERLSRIEWLAVLVIVIGLMFLGLS